MIPRYRSFQKPAISPRVFGGCLERRIPGKNGEVTPRMVRVLRGVFFKEAAGHPTYPRGNKATVSDPLKCPGILYVPTQSTLASVLFY